MQLVALDKIEELRTFRGKVESRLESLIHDNNEILKSAMEQGEKVEGYLRHVHDARVSKESMLTTIQEKVRNNNIMMQCTPLITYVCE